MPCDGGVVSYETRYDERMRSMKNHLNYVSDKLKLSIRECHSPEDGGTILCSILKGLTPVQLDEIVYNGRDKQARLLADWWDDHLEWDRQREEAEEKDRQYDLMIERIKSKLDKEELEFFEEYWNV